MGPDVEEDVENHTAVKAGKKTKFFVLPLSVEDDAGNKARSQLRFSVEEVSLFSHTSLLGRGGKNNKPNWSRAPPSTPPTPVAPSVLKVAKMRRRGRTTTVRRSCGRMRRGRKVSLRSATLVLVRLLPLLLPLLCQVLQLIEQAVIATPSLGEKQRSIRRRILMEKLCCWSSSSFCAVLGLGFTAAATTAVMCSLRMK